MAALISVYSGYVALAFLPPLIWLLFYLHEDRHPEPKHLLLLTFIAGIVSAIAAVAAELAFFGRPPVLAGFFYRAYPRLLAFPSIVFLGVGLIEEYLKYAAVRLVALSRRAFDEPVDAMIYLIAAALGFAAIENVFFIVPLVESSFAGRLELAAFTGGVELTASRFLGANLLHALSSAIVGYAVARHHFSPYRRHAIAIGVIVAGTLHALFNYFIISRDTIPPAILLIILLLVLMAAVVFVDFERLKRREIKAEIGK